MDESILLAVAFFGLGFIVATIVFLPLLISIRKRIKLGFRSVTELDRDSASDQVKTSQVQPPKPSNRQVEGGSKTRGPQRLEQIGKHAEVKVSNNLDQRQTQSLPQAETLPGSTRATKPAYGGDPLGNTTSSTRQSTSDSDHSQTWFSMEEAFEDEKSVSGIVKDKVKGGFLVDLGGIVGFLPDSRADIRVAQHLEQTNANPLDFRIQQFDLQQHRVVLARDGVEDSRLRSLREHTLDVIKVDDVVDGYVKNLVEYGAFLDIGGVDGLLHLRNMSWRRINEPGDVVTVGDYVKVKVLTYDPDNELVSLGLKQLSPDPWIGVCDRIRPFQRLTGTVTHIAPYGCFVELEPGVEGLAHISKLAWGEGKTNPFDIADIGEQLEVMVLSITAESKQVDLSVRHCSEIPWDEFGEEYFVGYRVSGIVQVGESNETTVLLPGNVRGRFEASAGASGSELRPREGELVDVEITDISNSQDDIPSVFLRLRSR